MFLLVVACLFSTLVLAEPPANPPASIPEVSAGRYFSKTRYEWSVGLTEAETRFDLPLTNPTDRPLRILAVETSCSCMKVSAPAPVIPPGGTGSVRCDFHVPNAVGAVIKPVILTTDAPQNPKEIVMVKVDVPSQLKLEPDRLVWSVGGPSDKRTVRVLVTDASTIHLSKVDCSREGFSWAVRTIQDGREYEIHVTPKDTGKPLAGLLLLASDSSVPRQKFRNIKLSIEPRSP